MGPTLLRDPKTRLFPEVLVYLRREDTLAGPVLSYHVLTQIQALRVVRHTNYYSMLGLQRDPHLLQGLHEAHVEGA